MGVDPRSDCRTAQWHREQLDLRCPGTSERFLHLTRIAAELLTEPDRRRVLEVRPTRLDHRPEFLLARGQRRVEALEGRQQALLDRDRGRQLERRGDRVVRALTAVYV